MNAEARLTELKIVLPPPPKPMAIYATAVRHGNLLHVSGHGPLQPDGTYPAGKLGADYGLEQGQAAARQTALAVLATVRAQLGSLDRVVRIVKVLGFVNCTQDFVQQPQVVNGFSDLMVQIFGDAALAVRSAVGAPSLPAGIPVEVEATFEVAP